MFSPTGGLDDIVKQSFTRRGKQNYECRDCGHQFVEAPQWRVIPPDSKALLEC
ncbi:IS1/IS1595 family N-terminal zinc-binding domain-containing protein [Trichocoleus desertorum]|uniref:IS1/IS1595 family N-terminal zinc-binding domain-containing protein n=1 Tax=Trichocoleus desertorum TaxID=1481672 RepID=UPI003D64F361